MRNPTEPPFYGGSWIAAEKVIAAADSIRAQIQEGWNVDLAKAEATKNEAITKARSETRTRWFVREDGKFWLWKVDLALSSELSDDEVWAIAEGWSENQTTQYHWQVSKYEKMRSDATNIYSNQFKHAGQLKILAESAVDGMVFISTEGLETICLK